MIICSYVTADGSRTRMSRNVCLAKPKRWGYCSYLDIHRCFNCIIGKQSHCDLD